AQTRALLDFAETLCRGGAPEKVEQALAVVEKSGIPRGTLAVSATLYAQQSKYPAVSALFSLS
ncbi:MAG: hypothetical protein AB1758_25565, partial [Candidatus Eremiobacterota bacterium]